MSNIDFNITLKVHGMENCVEKWMREIRVGMGELIEYWSEHY